MTSFRVVTDDEIERGLDLVAELIDRYGDVYWPVFDRLERELNERNARERRLESRLERTRNKRSKPNKNSLLAQKRY